MRKLLFSLIAALCIAVMPVPVFAQANRGGQQEEEKIKAPVVPYFVAILSIMIALVMVCMPSRRAFPQEEA